MPKARNGESTIGGRSGAGLRGAGGISGFGGDDGDGLIEMSNRIDERLMEAQTISVEVFSRSRNQSEIVDVTFDPATPGQAIVGSGSGRTYTVDTENQTCTCPDHIHRQARCRHIEAAGLAQEQIGQGTFTGSATNDQINTNQTLREHINNERALEQHNAERQFVDDGHFYSDNMDEFRRDMTEAEYAEIPYEYENALNGSDITFGVELEFVNGDSNAIARELFNLGICSSPRMVQYHSPGVPGKWKLERDGSVTRGDRGGELVSPILRDTPETWQQIETICEVAKRHGAQVNVNTGAHVHVSTEPLDGKRQRWRRLFKAFHGTEEAFFRVAGGELGRFRGGYYAESSLGDMRAGMRARMPEEGGMDDFRLALMSSSVGSTRYRSINFNSFTSNTRDTVELRVFNGTLTPGIIQANVKLSAGLIHAAERCRVQGDAENPTTASFRKRGHIINQHDRNGTDDETIVRMVDSFFTRKSDKEHILSVMAKNEWR